MVKGVPYWLRELRILHCHCSNSDGGPGSIPCLGTRELPHVSGPTKKKGGGGEIYEGILKCQKEFPSWLSGNKSD